MYLFHTGDVVVVNAENAKKVADFLAKHHINVEELANLHNANDEIDLSVEVESGDIEDSLRELIWFCQEENIKMDFDIRYSGDYTGGYSYKSGDAQMEFLDATDVAIADADDEHLIDACKRRGIWPNDEDVYRNVQHSYRLEDAESHLEDILEMDDSYESSPALCDREKLKEDAVRLFEKWHDCNIAENATWENIITRLLERRNNPDAFT